MDYRILVLVPADTIVRKGDPDIICYACWSCSRDIVHRIGISLAIAQRVYETAANDSGIAGEYRVPGAWGFGQDNDWIGLPAGCRIDGDVKDGVTILGFLLGVPAHAAPPYLELISCLHDG